MRLWLWIKLCWEASGYWLGGIMTLLLGLFFMMVRAYALFVLVTAVLHYSARFYFWAHRRITAWRMARTLNRDMDPRYRQPRTPPSSHWDY